MATGDIESAVLVSRTTSHDSTSSLTGGEYAVISKSTVKPSQISSRKASKYSAREVSIIPTGYMLRRLHDLSEQSSEAASRLREAAICNDAPAISVAASDLCTTCVELWELRRFGSKPWQQLVQTFTDILADWQSYEDIEADQAETLECVVSNYLHDRHLLPENRQNALQILFRANFDVFRKLSNEPSETIHE